MAFQEGGIIKIDADVLAGTTFKRWSVLFGGLSMAHSGAMT